MGKKLAIRGHSTRGKEVIELLEMMGGKNIHKRDGEANAYSYYLYDNAILSDRLSIAEDDDFEIFTLQDFLEKFPYKVGDKVHIYVQNDDVDGRHDIEVAEITSMRWNPDIRKIAYKMKNIKREFYKEEIKCKVDDSDKPTKVMGKKLAIKGHPTRGKEVIELLVMMGGTNPFSNGMVIGNKATNCYYISEDTATKYISWDYIGPDEINEYEIFTLEEFLDKFPFKIHDLVNIPEYESTVGICGMRWDPYSKHMEYMVYRCDDEEWYTTEELLDYNDNPNEIPKNTEEKKINQMSLANCDLDEVEIVLGDKFELKTKDGKYYAVRKKPKKLIYPTTYTECKNMIPKNVYYGYSMFMTLQNLIICRDVYWQIYGKQTGLGEPWKPDWSNDDETKFCIYTTQNIISLDIFGVDNKILAFPTEEMRDAFYENFKKEIEQCKELL